MKAPESLATKRLLLRKPRVEDAALIFAAYGQDPEVTRYLMWRPHRDLNEAQEAVSRFLEGWRAGNSFCWLLFRRDEGDLVGCIAARPEQGINLGYLLARPFWGQGLMSEGLAAVVDWAFSDPTVFRVWAVCDIENRASARLLSKSGFCQEGILKRWSVHPNISSIPRDCFCYARTRES
ncbi:MAG: [ribosomal protein S5]-alanine N-acetyltransferase [Acidimicrobiaceae bacterium]|jgi:RimJ/RimL family protein N-acetyltransferase|nr:[ribosomal protein S5]-alanine N-acetyltransferase [Acidimicrobiaceae bacterium]